MDRTSVDNALARIRHALEQRKAKCGGDITGRELAQDASLDTLHRLQGPVDKPVRWITLRNGVHIPIDRNGTAIGGAGGWAVGKDFSETERMNS